MEVRGIQQQQPGHRRVTRQKDKGPHEKKKYTRTNWTGGWSDQRDETDKRAKAKGERGNEQKSPKWAVSGERRVGWI